MPLPTLQQVEPTNKELPILPRRKSTGMLNIAETPTIAKFKLGETITIILIL